MSMKKFDEVCEFLEENDFVSVSIRGITKRVYINKKYGISVIVEKDLSAMTEADEELVKDRLRQLGYID